MKRMIVRAALEVLVLGFTAAAVAASDTPVPTDTQVQSAAAFNDLEWGAQSKTNQPPQIQTVYSPRVVWVYRYWWHPRTWRHYWLQWQHRHWWHRKWHYHHRWHRHPGFVWDQRAARHHRLALQDRFPWYRRALWQHPTAHASGGPHPALLHAVSRPPMRPPLELMGRAHPVPMPNPKFGQRPFATPMPSPRSTPHQSTRPGLQPVPMPTPKSIPKPAPMPRQAPRVTPAPDGPSAQPSHPERRIRPGPAPHPAPHPAPAPRPPKRMERRAEICPLPPRWVCGSESPPARNCWVARACV